MGWYTPELTTVQTRLLGNGFWEVVEFLLNVLLFGLVGLQLRPVLDGLSGQNGWSLVGDAALIALAVILLRIVWVFPATYVPRWLFPRINERDPSPPWRYPAFIAWNGMRGAVTIAAALLIPLETDSGAPLPGRDLIVFFAFAVVLATLVGQGLTLPGLIRVLRPRGRRRRRRGGSAGTHPRRRGGARAPRRARERVVGARRHRRAHARRSTASASTASRRAATPTATGRSRSGRSKYQRLRRELLDAERRAVVELRNTGEISDEVMRRVAARPRPRGLGGRGLG